MAVDDAGDLVVLQGRTRGAKRGLLAVEEGLNRGAYELHGHGVAIHIGEPQIEIMDLARHRPLHDLAGDLHGRDPVHFPQLRCDPRRFPPEQPDGFRREHVGVYVNGEARAHL